MRPSTTPLVELRLYLRILPAVGVCIALAGTASAAPLVTGLGGVRDYGENVLPPNDDASTGAIDITPVFGPGGLNFYGTNYTALYVNNNGNVTFGSASGTFSPPPMATATQALIGAWWADVDTSGTHSPPDTNLVYYDVDPVGGAVTVTWDLVGYFPANTSLLNSFQIRLIDQGSGDFDIEYRYDQLQWAVPGPARAGFTAGNGISYFDFPESGISADMLDLVNRTNVAEPGRFVFESRAGQIEAAHDGIIDDDEECDDGNLVDGDGCDASGQIEDCWSCTGEPSACAPATPTITTLDSTGSVGRYASVALGSDGLPIIAYYDDTNDRIKTAHCNDAACTSATINVVDGTVGDLLGWQHAVKVEIGSDGLPFVAYYSLTAQLLRLAHCDDVACTTSNRINMDVGQTNSGIELGLAIGSDGYPIVTHGEPAQNWRRVVHCLSHDCVLRNTYTAGQPGYRYGHTTVGADGFGLSVHGTGGEIRANHCDDLDCSSSTDTVVVTATGALFWVGATDIVRAPNGLGFFTYHEGDAGELRVARCTNASCSSVSTSTVDAAVGTTAGTAASSSILFDGDGHARIAYWDTDDGDLRLANCLDAGCTTSSLITLDSADNVGRDASMVRSGTGLLISYYDTTNSNLKAAFCAGNSGNGVVDNGEECDDGNLVGGDGCSTEGELEACYSCAGEPSVCTEGCADGENLDPGFDLDGKATLPIGSGDDRANAIAIQADGKAVVAGRTLNGGFYDFAVARYNTDGSLDTTFSGDGVATLAIGSENDIATAVAIQADGRIVVVGITWQGAASYDVALVRYDTDGNLDPSFHGDGIKLAALGGDDRANSVAIQSDGKIVVGGHVHDGIDSDFMVARFNTDGTDDATFSGDGVTTTEGFGTFDGGNAVAIQPNQKIVLAGRSISGGNNDFAVLRYNTDGSLDTSFSGDGKLWTAIGNGSDEAMAVLVQSDQKIVVAGRAHNGSNFDFAVVRYNYDGSLDTTFSGDGVKTTAFGSGDDVAHAVAIRADGKIVAAGYANTGSSNDFAVVRLDPDGTLDTGFAGDGRATTAIGAGDDRAYAVAVDSDGRIVAAGEAHNGSNYDFALVRYADAACGNGAVEPGEQCDDGNLAAGDCCSTTCQFEADGASCPDDGLACSTDLCDGAGACVHAAGNAGATCRGPAGVCDAAETCDGASTACPVDVKFIALCRGSAGECDLSEACDGLADDCPADVKRTNGTACTSDGNVCTDDVCNGSLDACTHPANAAPCNDGTFCNGADTCSGGACSSHAGDPCSGGTECADACNEAADNCFDVAATPCAADGNICTDDVCDGAGSCGANNTAPCDDNVFCNGTDTCAGGVCSHAGDPCPGTDCNTCQEGNDSCFDPADTPCEDEPDQCTNDRCDGAGACTHSPIALAEVCNWAIVAGSDTVSSKVRTRLSVGIGGGVCANKADIGVNTTLDDASWAVLRDSGLAIRFRGAADVGTGSVATGGGCVRGSEGILDSALTEICCEDGTVPLAAGGEVDACGLHDAITACATAKAQVAADIAMLDSLEPTLSLGSLSCSPSSPCTITAADGLNVIDISKITIQTDGVLTIDGDADDVVVLRVAAGVKSKLGGSIALSGGLQASQLAIYAADGGCKFGDGNVGHGTLFCPNGKVQMKLNTVWHGSIASGSGVNLNDNVVFDHVPFLGLAD